MLTPYRFASLALSFALIAASCGGEDDPPAEPDECAAGHDHAAAGHDHCDTGSEDDEDEVVPCPAQYPAFRAGLQAKAGDLTVRLLSVDPDPVRQKRNNTWVLEVVDATGAPVAGASIVEADTWMDVHNHGGRWEPDVNAGSAPGQFELSNIDFKMPGPWRLRIGVKASGAAAIERPNFQICVE